MRKKKKGTEENGNAQRKQLLPDYALGNVDSSFLRPRHFAPFSSFKRDSTIGYADAQRASSDDLQYMQRTCGLVKKVKRTSRDGNDSH